MSMSMSVGARGVIELGVGVDVAHCVQHSPSERNRVAIRIRSMVGAGAVLSLLLQAVRIQRVASVPVSEIG